jgi:uncharacterized protein YjbI with pentapeptide repeats
LVNAAEKTVPEHPEGPATRTAKDITASAECCPVEMHDGKPCGRRSLGALVDGIPYCLMHTPLGKDPVAFQREFDRILDDADEGVVDCTRFVFPTAGYKGKQFVTKCVFSGATFAEGTDFRGATFKESADFSGASFKMYADFSGATFTQDANFCGATFLQKTWFNDAKFVQDAHFEQTTFTQVAYFIEATFMDYSIFGEATFTQDADFSNVTFTADANFIEAKFERNADFRRAMFEQSADFDVAAFSKNAYFRGACFKKNADFKGATFTQYVDFSLASFFQLSVFWGARFFGAAEFRETFFRGCKDEKAKGDDCIPGPSFSLAEFSQPEKVVFYKTYLGQALFHNSDVSKLRFSSVKWRKRNRNGKRMVFEEEVDLNAARDLRPARDSSDERDYGLIAELYQQLKKNYDDKKDYWTAGDFHFGEMEMKRLASRRKKRVLRWLHRNLGLVAWYKYASQYGESYVRPGIWLVVTLLLFGLLFPTVGLRYDPAKDTPGSGTAFAPVVLTYRSPLFPGQPLIERHKAQWRLFGNGCLTSLQIAAFQKEPAYQPVSARGRFMTVLETLITSILAALFFLALNRQFRR